MAMPRLDGSTSLQTRPPISTVPELTSSRPATMRSRVDLPQPEGPTSTTNSPSAMSRSTPLMTRLSSYCFVMPCRRTDDMDSPLDYRTYPFNPVAARNPCVTRRWNSTYASATGSAPISAAAISWA